MTNVIAYEPSAPPGERLAPEVRAEIAEVAPSVLDDGSVTAPKLAEKAVTTGKLNEGAVTSVKIATGGVAAINLAAGAVNTAALAADSVTDEKAGPGVVQAHDKDGNPITVDVIPITAAQFASITASPSGLYVIIG